MDEATRPTHWNSLYRVSGWIDEHPHAQKLCEVLGYTTDEQGSEAVKVRFMFRTDLFDPEFAILSPFMLFPERPS